jgi:hypothetical protein
MTREETLKIYELLQETYDMKMTELAIEAWYQVLKDHSFEDCKMATFAYLKTQHFKPVPADISNLIMDRKIAQNVKKPERLSPMVAWSLVYKAICNSNYNSEEEFNKLPDECKKVIGSSDMLRMLAKEDIKTVNSVHQSLFQRIYESDSKRQADEFRLKIEQVKRGEMSLGELLQDNPKAEIGSQSGYLFNTDVLTACR